MADRTNTETNTRMSPNAGVSNFGSGFSYASYGSPIFNDLAFVPASQESITAQKKPIKSSELNILYSYISVLLAIDFIGTKSTQRILYNKATRDTMKGHGMSFNQRYAASLLVTTPLIVTAQEITSPFAQERRKRVCPLPLDTGEGTQSIEKFYYDTGTDTCTKFTYKGTLGNENNFKSKARCDLTCRPYSTEGQASLKREITKAFAVDSFVFLGSSKMDTLRTAIYTVFVAKAIGSL